MKVLFSLIAVAGAAIVCLPLLAADSGCGMSKASVPAAAAAEPAAAVAKAQAVCAVCGAPMSKDFYSDVEGQRVYFCCAACKATFDAGSKTYLEKMAKDGVAPEAIPAAPAAK